MPQFTVRDYRQSDWPAICRIHDLARLVEVGRFVPWDAIVPMARTAHAEGFLASQSSVACVDDAESGVAGFISIAGSELTWCYVDPSWHRQGVGRKLVQHVLPKLGADAFVLCVGENPAALAFYRSFGFVIAARFPGDAYGYPCQCVRLTLPTSKHRRRLPTPSKTALRLADFTETSPGQAFLGEDGVYYWR